MTASETRQMQFIPLVSVSADNTALDGTTATKTYRFGDKPASAVELGPEFNNVEIFFFGKAAADKYANYKVWAYRENGPAVLVCNGVVTLGTALQASDAFYADTIIAVDNWGNVSVIDSGNNRVARLMFALRGYKYIYVEVDIVAAQISELNAVVSGF